MIQLTKIECADITVNFWEGCTKVSPGCKHCYAETRDERFHDGIHWGPGAPRRTIGSGPALARRVDRLAKQKRFVRTRDGRRTELQPGMTGTPVRPIAFTMSLGDFFDPEVNEMVRMAALRTIMECDGIDWMILTKRPALVMSQLAEARDAAKQEMAEDDLVAWLGYWLVGKPPRHVAIGTSAEDQKWFDRRVPTLKRIPAAARFVSCEPLLGPIDINAGVNIVDLIITGGESGAQARPCSPEWVYEIERQCDVFKIDFHHKQWGEWVDHQIVEPENHNLVRLGLAITPDGNVSSPMAAPQGERHHLLWRAGKAHSGNALLRKNGDKEHRNDLIHLP